VKLKQVDHKLQLEVIDDGRGITDAETKNTTSLGLLGMKERALLVGGSVSIAGMPEKGTTVVVTIPLKMSGKPESIA
jgi:signal transduction histidine kinase